MESHCKILSAALLVLILFVSLGVAQCFFVTEYACTRINGICSGVWAPFIYIALPYSVVYGREKNRVWKYFTVSTPDLCFLFIYGYLHRIASSVTVDSKKSRLCICSTEISRPYITHYLIVSLLMKFPW